MTTPEVRRAAPAPSTAQVRPTAWGAAWIEGLVLGNTFDGTELARGRGLAARGGVVRLEIEPAAVAGVVRGRAAVDRTVRLGFRRLDDRQWSTVTKSVAASSRSALELLDGRLPTTLHDRLVDAGCGLVPGVRDVSIDCSCGNLAESCVHAAAVCCRLADLLDDDPLVLVTLRGGDRAGIVGAFAPLVRRPDDHGREARPSVVPGRHDDPTMPGGTAWRRSTADLPDIDSRVKVGLPRAGATPPPAELGVDQAGLDRLVRDAAMRAAAVLAGDAGAAALHLDEATDAVRRLAAGVLDEGATAALAGCPADAVPGLVDGWRSSGAAGVDVLLRPRRLDEHEVGAVEAGLGVTVKQRSTGAVLPDGAQVRRAGDGRWLLLRSDELRGWRVVDSSDDVADLTVSRSVPG